MASLKSIKAHAVAVGNIQKITNTIKMVATSKFMQAERRLRWIRAFGHGTRRFYQVSKISYDPKNGRSVVLTSDRGLCGGLHTRVCKKVRNDQVKEPSEGGIVCLGEKGRSLLSLYYKKQFRLIVNGLGHKGPTFKQAANISQRIFDDWNIAMLTFALFHNFVSFEIITIPLLKSEPVLNSSVPHVYEIDDDDLEFYLQFSTASLIFYAMNESYVSEQANRVTAMSVAAKNAGKMKKQLMLQYNRKRQEKITTEIIDIISGLKATQKKTSSSSRDLKYLIEGEDGPLKEPSQELLQYLPMESIKQFQEALLQPISQSNVSTQDVVHKQESKVEETKQVEANELSLKSESKEPSAESEKTKKKGSDDEVKENDQSDKKQVCDDSKKELDHEPEF